MSDGERRLEAAAHAVAREIAHSARESEFHEDSLVPCVNTYYDAVIIAKAAIDAYDRPLEPVVPELVTQMATAMFDIPGCPLDAVPYARAALRVVCKRLSTPLPPTAIANYLGLSEQYVKELLDE